MVVKVTNNGKKYIRQINASIVDEEGERYCGEGYIRNDSMVIVDRYKNVFYTEWVGIVNTLKLGQIRIFPVAEETEDVMRPGESYEWVFIFIIPENRSIKKFILDCGIATTPTGFPEIYKITISPPGLQNRT